MTTNSSSASWRESPVFFDGPPGSALFGVVTSANPAAGGLGAVVLPGGGYFGSASRNGFFTQLCRQLASIGTDSLRFDWHGVGDSAGHVTRFELDRPFVDDLVGAASCIRARGAERLLLIGSCFGARTALAGAPRLDGVDALVLMSMPMGADPLAVGARLAGERSVRDELRRVARPSAMRRLLKAEQRRAILGFATAKARSRLTRGATQPGDQTRGGPDTWVLEGLDRLSSAGVRILLLYGDLDDEYGSFREMARRGRLEEILTRETVDVEVLPGQVHHPLGAKVEDAMLESIIRWTDRRFSVR